jgi:hypothetical protein
VGDGNSYNKIVNKDIDRNTGRVKYALGNDPTAFQYNRCLPVPPRLTNSTPPDLTYCRFQLYNNSIEECSWGPWGLGSQTDTDTAIPFSSSPVFRVLATNDTHSTPQANSNNTTAPETATINLSCPVTGIPSQPPTIFRQNDDIWPPLAGNLIFPILNNT